jgi:pantoate--beta-alanine ligase
VQVFTTIKDLHSALRVLNSKGKTIGFVPTMGALHQGHISLINYSKQQCDVTVCSIFVNPTQFNNPDDLDKYPKTPENDKLLLEKAGCDFLYLPSVEDIYPEKDNRIFNFGFLDTVLEGALRPGHFNGVGQVVSILLEHIEPNKAFFGSKDYQQVMVVKELVKQLNIPVEIISCPILRESDGLAMSSRNIRLNDQERIIASLIPKIMLKASDIVKAHGITASKQFVEEITSQITNMKLDYFEVCNSSSLKKLDKYETAQPTVLLIAIFVGKTRLIDNLIIE